MGTLKRGNGSTTGGVPFVPMLSHACLSKGGSGRLDPSCETFIACTLPATDGGVSSGMHPVIPCWTLRAHHSVNGNPENVIAFNARQDPDSWQERTGPIDTDGCTQAIAIGSRARGDDGRGYERPEHISDIAGTVDATKPERVLTPQMQVRRLTPVECARLQGFPDDYLELKYGSEAKAHAAQVLHELWKSASSFAREGWRLGVAASLLTPQVLLSGVHGGWISWDVAARCASSRGSLSGEAVWPENFLRALRFNSEYRPSPYRRESFEQLERESQGLVSKLSYERAQTEAFLFSSGLWEEAQRTWPLRYALATTSQIKSNKMNPDGPRYRAIGNSMAVPVMRWICERLAGN
jgi:hypothetical protein